MPSVVRLTEGGRTVYRATVSLGWDPATRTHARRPSKRFRGPGAEAAAWTWARQTEEAATAAPRQVVQELRDEPFGKLLAEYGRRATEGKRSRDRELAMLRRWGKHPIASRRCLSLLLEDGEALRAELELTLAPASVRRSLGLLCTVLRWGANRGWLEFYPWKGLELPRAPKGRNRAPSDAELDALMHASGVLEHRGAPRDVTEEAALAFALGCEAALRLSEITRARRANIALERGVVLLAEGETKSGEPREVPLTHAAVEHLRRLLLSEAPSEVLASGEIVERLTVRPPRAISDAFARLRKSCGIGGEREAGGLTFHDSRHRGYTRLVHLLDDPYLVARAVGHASLAEAMTYFEVDVGEMVRRVRAGERAGQGRAAAGTEEEQLPLTLESA